MKKRVKMNEQSPNERIKNFNEVALGYTYEQAVEEANRCLQCKKAPCKTGCPANVLIPEFIKALREGDIFSSYKILKIKNNLPAVCGRVCPQENQCEKVCVLAKQNNSVAIGRLERFVADYGLKNNFDEKINHDYKENTGIKVAVVGSGPSGITCAADLAKLGYSVTVFEALHKPGGVLVYGIPEFRLPKSIVRHEIDMIKSLGVKVETDVLFGKSVTLEELKNDGYRAVFIGTGAGLPRYMGIEGEELSSCYSANEFLTRINLLKAYEFPKSKTPVYTGKKVLVVGGGNVAMDAARSARRMGAEVFVAYRRTEKEMPARLEEIEHAKEEGIKFLFLSNPEKFEGDEKGFVKKAVLRKMKLGEPDESGRRRPVKTDETFELDVDSVIIAIGNKPNPIAIEALGVKTNKWGNIETDDNLMTSIKGVFAGGDIVSGAATVIEAIGAGKIAALNIDKYIKDGGNIIC